MRARICCEVKVIGSKVKFVICWKIGFAVLQSQTGRIFTYTLEGMRLVFVQVYRPWYFWRFERGQPFLAKNTDIFVSNFFLQRNFKFFLNLKLGYFSALFHMKLNILGSIVFLLQKSKVWNQNNPLFLKNALLWIVRLPTKRVLVNAKQNT